MASPIGFEPTAPRLGILCSILLSYGDTRRSLQDFAAAAKPAAAQTLPPTFPFPTVTRPHFDPLYTLHTPCSIMRDRHFRPAEPCRRRAKHRRDEPPFGGRDATRRRHARRANAV